MTHFTDVTGVAGVSICSLLIILNNHFFYRLQLMQRAMLAGVLLIVALLPFGGLSAAEFVRGISGDLSVTTLLLMGFALCGNLPARPFFLEGNSTAVRTNENVVLIFIASAALVLYPSSLGVGMFDTYRLGFGNLWFILALLLLALIAWKLQYTLLTLGVSLAVLAWSVGWYESNNLWDYLLDPWVAIYALVVLIKRGVSMLAKQFS
jgi:hypothetical protein